MGAVHKYRGRGIDTLDLVQEGNVSLYQALEGFDWTRDVRFKTYAEYWVNQAFLKILYNGVRTVRVPVWVQKALKKIRDLQTDFRQSKGREASPDELGAAPRHARPEGQGAARDAALRNLDRRRGRRRRGRCARRRSPQ